MARRRRAASAPLQGTTSSVPGGRPAAVAISARAGAVSEASSAGAGTRAVSMASAAPTERPTICIGWFHGTMRTVTPRGPRSVTAV